MQENHLSSDRSASMVLRCKKSVKQHWQIGNPIGTFALDHRKGIVVAWSIDPSFHPKAGNPDQSSLDGM
jgi:hypothetical protein